MAERFILFRSLMPSDDAAYASVELGRYATLDLLEQAARDAWQPGQHLTSWDGYACRPVKAWKADGTTVNLAAVHDLQRGTQTARIADAKATKKASRAPKSTTPTVDLTSVFNSRRTS